MKNDKVKIVFAPGCFDGFTGSQEELDELIAEITRMAEDGTFLTEAEVVDVDVEQDEFLMNALREFLTGQSEIDDARDADFGRALDEAEAQRKRRLN